jgi:hypothetical protein
MRRKRWLWSVVALTGILLFLSFGVSRFLHFGRVHRYLVGRLESAFGRPVEVRRFDFNLLDGLRIQANSITVAEDPRYGNEYFLRADQLTAGPRWRSLVRGRFEFGTVSFTHPSLNMVRGPDGHWNLESWLPPPPPAGPLAPEAGALPGASPLAPGRLYRIEVGAGRINFKFGADKSPFALADVAGSLEQETPGRWRVDLEAHPVRATVALQDAGTIRVQGRIAGTSARLQPAELTLSWQEASLADALRLARGRDFGVRGSLALVLTARIAPPSAEAAKQNAAAHARSEGARWKLQATLRLVGMHRWDLPQRASDPAVNLLADAEWQAGAGEIQLARYVLEAPRSSVRGLGAIRWSPTFVPELRLLGSRVEFADLLSWYRAFHTGVAEEVKLDGILGLDLTLKGWPPRLEAGLVESPGGQLESATLRTPLRVGQLRARVRQGRLEFEPVTLAFGPLPSTAAGAAHARLTNALRITGVLATLPARANDQPGASPAHTRGWSFELATEGQLDRIQDLFTAGRVLGRSISAAGTAEGPVALGLRSSGRFFPYVAQTLGEVDFNGVRWQAACLNQPIVLEKVKLEMIPGEWRMTLASARAFGAGWKGTLAHAGSAPWSFELATDRLEAADLDRWLGPRARPPGLLERIMPSTSADGASSEIATLVGAFRAVGKLDVRQFVLGSLRLERLRGRLEIQGRRIALRAAEAEFYKGKVRGEMTANLSAQPVYHFNLQGERVDLSSLADATATLKGRFAGTAGGELVLRTRGIGRAELVTNLEGNGTLRARRAQFHGLDLEASLARGAARSGTSHFAELRADFFVAAGRIRLQDARLSNPPDELELRGSVDFSQALDLRLGTARTAGLKNSAPADAKSLRILGSVAAPRVAPPVPASADK